MEKASNNINKKKICFIAQFPPPIHGLSKAVETLYNSELNQEFDFEKVDLTNNKKFFGNLIKIFKSKADLFYFTISQTKSGNIRDLIILKILQLQHKKCLIHLHGGYYRKLIDNDVPKWQRKANYTAISKLQGAIVLGESLKYNFEGMLSKEKIFVVPNCVDDEFLLSKDEFEGKLENIKTKQVKDILYLSNFIKEKGYEDILKLAKLEKENFEKNGVRNFNFHFAGKFFDKASEKEFFEYIKKNNLDEYITYYGVVSGDKKRELLKKCDMFILLTKYAKEGQPISILEAMGNGMVIVTTKHAGIPDVVITENGILVNKEEIILKDIFDKLQKIDCTEIAITNFNKKEGYSQENYINNFKYYLERLI